MSGWIGVDLDGTLAHYDEEKFPAIGEPLAPMVAQVKVWIAEGKDVRIFTARVACAPIEACAAALVRAGITPGPRPDLDWHNYQLALIEDWCLAHLGCVLPITCTKDFEMIELWDDRCVQMKTNTGRSLVELIIEAVSALP